MALVEHFPRGGLAIVGGATGGLDAHVPADAGRRPPALIESLSAGDFGGFLDDRGDGVPW